ncbi:uncharacterized protein [Ptychodera flava]|uniref:uncharacterized protein n=1 Tax=Ptychodera flava TaxID=63121 RepID=UPI00396A5417
MEHFKSALVLAFLFGWLTFVTAQDVLATTFTVDTPSGVTYSVNGDVTITFDLVVTENNAGTGSLTDINLYFSNNAEYESATVKSTPAVRASKPLSGTPESITQNTAATVSDAEATLRPDEAQCSQYTHLCAVITSNDVDGNSNDDDKCLALTAPTAGVIDCTVATTAAAGSTEGTDTTTEITTASGESGIFSKNMNLGVMSVVVLTTVSLLSF